MSEFTIRLARPEDFAAINEVDQAVGDMFRDFGVDTSQSDSDSQSSAPRFFDEGTRAWVATIGDDDGVAGYIFVFPLDDAAYIAQVSVHPAHQRKGLGTALLDTADAWAEVQGLSALSLVTYTDVPWNAPWYRRIGFTDIGDARMGDGLRRLLEVTSAVAPGWRRSVMRRPTPSNRSVSGTSDGEAEQRSLVGARPTECRLDQSPVGFAVPGLAPHRSPYRVERFARSGRWPTPGSVRFMALVEATRRALSKLSKKVAIEGGAAVPETTAFTIGAVVRCTDGVCGRVTQVVLDPIDNEVTHLIVEPQHRMGLGRLVPVDLADSDPDQVTLRCSSSQFAELPKAEDVRFLPGTEGYPGYEPDQVFLWPFFAGNTAVPEVADTLPVGEVAVQRGEKVHTTDGPIGEVAGLVVDPRNHHVTHVLLEEGHLLGHGDVAIPIGAVKAVDPDGIRLSLSKQEVEALHRIDIGHRRS
jgi:GNAT superfamily N-acetyltransferase/sporulation protein YlmC with PRC-barrel domain